MGKPSCDPHLISQTSFAVVTA